MREDPRMYNENIAYKLHREAAELQSEQVPNSVSQELPPKAS